MPRRRVRFFYYFRGNLESHVHFYQSWVEAVGRRGIEMTLLTFLGPREYLRQRKFMSGLRSQGVRILLDSPGQFVSRAFFFVECLFNRTVVVHLKKRAPDYFDRLRRRFPRRLVYISEGEGDALSELDYLRRHPYKNGFYERNIAALRRDVSRQEKILRNADYCTFGYQAMEDLLAARYPHLGLDEKITLVPMSFSAGSLGYSTETRERTRKRLGVDGRFVLLYAGSAYYSWQNVSRTIGIFRLVKESLVPNAFLLLLTRRNDFGIVAEFLAHHSLSMNDYLLTNVPHSEIRDYLNAADMGVCLRSPHTMNKTTPSGKVLDYLGCGLPTLTTDAMGEVSDMIRERDFGVVLEDMDDDAEVLSRLAEWINRSDIDRQSISEWADQHLSIDATIGGYVSLLRTLAESHR